MEELSGQTVGALLVGVTILLTFLASQLSTKARDQRRRLRVLTRRDIAFSGWVYKVQRWAAARGHTDLPRLPKLLAEDEEDEQ